MIRVGDVTKNKACFFSRRLHMDITKIKKRWNNSFNRACDILNFYKIKFAYMPYKKPALFNVNDAFICDDP